MDKFTKAIESIKGYLQGVRTEFKRVAWPNKHELKASTIIVLVTLFSITIYMWACDEVFIKVFEKLRGFKTPVSF
jgi:preprotein translocase SecE subunit